MARAEPCIDEIVSHLKNGEAFSAPRNNLYDRLMSGSVNPIFYRVVVKAKAFRGGPMHAQAAGSVSGDVR